MFDKENNSPVEKEHKITPLMNKGNKVWRSCMVCSS